MRHRDKRAGADMGALSELAGPPKYRTPIRYIGEPSPDPAGPHPGPEPNNSFRPRRLRLSYGTFRRLASGLRWDKAEEFLTKGNRKTMSTVHPRYRRRCFMPGAILTNLVLLSVITSPVLAQS